MAEQEEYYWFCLDKYGNINLSSKRKHEHFAKIVMISISLK